MNSKTCCEQVIKPLLYSAIPTSGTTIAFKDKIRRIPAHKPCPTFGCPYGNRHSHVSVRDLLDDKPKNSGMFSLGYCVNF